MPYVECLHCHQKIPIGKNTNPKDLVTCPKCAVIYEVTSLKPVSISWPDDPQIISSRRMFHKTI